VKPTAGSSHIGVRSYTSSDMSEILGGVSMFRAKSLIAILQLVRKMIIELRTSLLRWLDMLICHELWGHTRGAIEEVGRCMKHERNLIWEVDLESAKIGPSSHSRAGGGSCVEISMTKFSFESAAVNLYVDSQLDTCMPRHATVAWLGVLLLKGYEKGPHGHSAASACMPARS
jgi:hypothetical protein